MALRWSLENICEDGDAIDMALPDGAWGKRAAKEVAAVFVFSLVAKPSDSPICVN
jgi:hypothetical protein